jgi:hypothetical protein
MAQEEAQSRLYPYLTSKYTMKSLFGISMTNDNFVEDSYFIYRGLGNVATAVHAYNATISLDGYVGLPCNCEFVDSVSEGTFSYIDDDDITVIYSDPNTVTVTGGYSFLPDVISDPGFKRYNLSKSQLHAEGEFIPYEIDINGCDRRLKFDSRFIGHQVQIIYKGVLMDDDKNPLLTYKEVEAIAYKMAFIHTQKRAFKGDPEAVKMLTYIKQESEKKAVSAKIPEYLSQNFFDRLLSAKTRIDRKVFYSSYKLLQ